MTIPGRGDLSPPRRYRRRRWPRRLLALLVVAALAAGGWYAYDRWLRDDDATVRAAAPTSCATPTHPPAPARLADVRVDVLNGTKRVGLAHRLARHLHQRGAGIGRVGNSKQRVAHTAVTHPPEKLAAALAVREQVAGPAQVQAAPGARLALVIGKDFGGLASPADAAAARAADTAKASPSPPACAAS